MKNFKEQFNKIKFLITLIVGITIMLFVNGTHKMSAGVGYCILGLSIWISIHQFRMAFDKKYNDKQTKLINVRINERKQQPWYVRYDGGAAAPQLDITLIFIYAIIPMLILVDFLSIGFSKGVWNLAGIILPILFLLILIIACKNTYKKPPKK